MLHAYELCVGKHPSFLTFGKFPFSAAARGLDTAPKRKKTNLFSHTLNPTLTHTHALARKRYLIPSSFSSSLLLLLQLMTLSLLRPCSLFEQTLALLSFSFTPAVYTRSSKLPAVGRLSHAHTIHTHSHTVSHFQLWIGGTSSGGPHFLFRELLNCEIRFLRCLVGHFTDNVDGELSLELMLLHWY